MATDVWRSMEAIQLSSWVPFQFKRKIKSYEYASFTMRSLNPEQVMELITKHSGNLNKVLGQHFLWLLSILDAVATCSGKSIQSSRMCSFPVCSGFARAHRFLMAGFLCWSVCSQCQWKMLVLPSQ